MTRLKSGAESLRVLAYPGGGACYDGAVERETGKCAGESAMGGKKVRIAPGARCIVTVNALRYAAEVVALGHDTAGVP